MRGCNWIRAILIIARAKSAIIYLGHRCCANYEGHRSLITAVARPPCRRPCQAVDLPLNDNNLFKVLFDSTPGAPMTRMTKYKISLTPSAIYAAHRAETAIRRGCPRYRCRDRPLIDCFRNPTGGPTFSHVASPVARPNSDVSVRDDRFLRL